MRREDIKLGYRVRPRGQPPTARIAQQHAEIAALRRNGQTEDARVVLTAARALRKTWQGTYYDTAVSSHEGIQKYLDRSKCDLCGAEFNRPKDVLPHKRAVHPETVVQ